MTIITVCISGRQSHTGVPRQGTTHCTLLSAVSRKGKSRVLLYHATMTNKDAQETHLCTEELTEIISEATQTTGGEEIDGEASIAWVVPRQEALKGMGQRGVP